MSFLFYANAAHNSLIHIETYVIEVKLTRYLGQLLSDILTGWSTIHKMVVMFIMFFKLI